MITVFINLFLTGTEQSFGVQGFLRSPMKDAYSGVHGSPAGVPHHGGFADDIYDDANALTDGLERLLKPLGKIKVRYTKSQ